MNRIASLLLSVILLLSLCACKASQSSQPSAEIKFQAHYIRTDWNIQDGGKCIPDQIMVIRSTEELNTQLGFLDKSTLSRYDDAYFAKQILIVVLRSEGSGSIRHKVAHLKYTESDHLDIAIETITPEIGTADIAGWHILIEPEAGTQVDSARNILVNGEPLGNCLLSVTGDTDYLAEPLRKFYWEGESVTVKITIPSDGHIFLYINGTPLPSPKEVTSASGRHWEFSFTAPREVSMLRIEHLGPSSMDDTQGGRDEHLCTVINQNGATRCPIPDTSEKLRQILSAQNYDKNIVGECRGEYNLDDGFGIRYEIHLTEGYARCHLGQAKLSESEIQALRDLLEPLYRLS